MKRVIGLVAAMLIFSIPTTPGWYRPIIRGWERTCNTSANG
jgi:hypothetical protein